MKFVDVLSSFFRKPCFDVLALFVVIGTVIVRDARRNVPEDQLRRRQRDQGPHKHERQAKAKARAKGRAARRARKKTVRNR